MRIVIGSDHGGFQLKEHLKAQLELDGHEVLDVGPRAPEPTDYPDWGVLVAEKVVELAPSSPEGATVRGIAICGSGIGISMAANKVPGARAALVHDVTTARLARQHNDANIVCFGERTSGRAIVEEALRVFLETEFEGGRHEARVRKLDRLGRG